MNKSLRYEVCGTWSIHLFWRTSLANVHSWLQLSCWGCFTTDAKRGRLVLDFWGLIPTLIYQLMVLQHVCRISSQILIIFCNDSSNVVIRTSRKRHEIRRRQDINSSTRNFTDKNENKETLLRIIKLQLIPSIFSTSRINILTPISRAYMPIQIYLREANISCQYRSSNISLGL